MPQGSLPPDLQKTLGASLSTLGEVIGTLRRGVPEAFDAPRMRSAGAARWVQTLGQTAPPLCVGRRDAHYVFVRLDYSTLLLETAISGIHRVVLEDCEWGRPAKPMTPSDLCALAQRLPTLEHLLVLAHGALEDAEVVLTRAWDLGAHDSWLATRALSAATLGLEHAIDWLTDVPSPPRRNLPLGPAPGGSTDPPVHIEGFTLSMPVPEGEP